jgi:hypothetical protein
LKFGRTKRERERAEAEEALASRRLGQHAREKDGTGTPE